eukprot:2215702-Amphidinium_carterae.2
MQFARRPAMPAQNSESVGATERVSALLEQLGSQGPIDLFFSNFALEPGAVPSPDLLFQVLLRDLQQMDSLSRRSDEGVRVN